VGQFAGPRRSISGRQAIAQCFFQIIDRSRTRLRHSIPQVHILDTDIPLNRTPIHCDRFVGRAGVLRHGGLNCVGHRQIDEEQLTEVKASGRGKVRLSPVA
jgi:hypothetical protein